MTGQGEGCIYPQCREPIPHDGEGCPGPTGQGEGGAVLGEEALLDGLQDARVAIHGVFDSEEWRDLLPLPYPDMLTAEVFAALAPHVVALVDQARADGAAEERADVEAEWEKHYADLSERERHAQELRQHFEALAYHNGLAKDAAEGVAKRAVDRADAAEAELFRVREQLAGRRSTS